MRASTVCFTAFLAILATGSIAAAQMAKSAAGPNAVENRYFTSLGDILDDLPVDAFIKETRQSGKTLSTTLDVCYSVSATSERKDRFAIDLKADGAKLTGSGTSFEDKSPVTVSLVRKPAGKAVTFEGKITIGSRTSQVSSTENSESDEAEFQESQIADNNLAEAPADFTEVSPQAVAVKVKREAFLDLAKSLKSDRVLIALESIATDCAALRTGVQLLRMTVDPARAGALVAKLKASPGVVGAGWIAGSYDMERAIRLPAAAWRDGDSLNRDKLAAAISQVAAKAMDAKAAATKWNDTTGELTIALKRPNTTVPALDLTDTIEMTALVGPEKPGASDRLIVWLGVPATTTTDDAAGPHLEFLDTAPGEEDGSFSDDDHVIKALAAELKGQRWNEDASSWK